MKRSERMFLRKRKTLCLFLASLILLAGTLFCGDAMAAEGGEQRLMDEAGLFGSEEAEELEREIADTADQVGFDVAILTTDDTGGKSSQLYADDEYEARELGSGSDRSGILFLLDMDGRELVLSTDGKAKRIFTDSRMETMLDGIYDRASDGDFYGAAMSFLSDVRYYGKQGIPQGQYNGSAETGEISVYRSISPIEFLLAAGIALFVAGTAVLTIKRQYNMEDSGGQAAGLNAAYREDTRIQNNASADQLIGRFTTTAIIAAAAASFAGRSNSSSRRTTTHRSSSGRSHGGASRKF